MATIDRLLDALDIQIQPFAICDVCRGSRLELPSSEFDAIHYSIAGHGRLTIGRSFSFDLMPDQMIVIPRGLAQTLEATGGGSQGTSHCVDPPDGMHWLQSGQGESGIIMACGLVRATYGERSGIFDLLHEPIVESFEPAASIRPTFEAMLHEFSDPRIGSTALVGSLMKQCLILLLRRLHEVQDQRVPWLALLEEPRLEAAVLAMIENPEASHNVESLAEMAGMSRSAFTDHFGRIFGCPPHVFLTELRLRHAARLLSTTHLPIKTVSAKSGYQSRSSFSRAFKSAYGLDPAAYRAADKGSN